MFPSVGIGSGGGGGATALTVYDATTLATPAGHPDLRVEDLTVTGVAVITSTATATGGFATSAQAGIVFSPYGAGAGETGEARWLELAAGGVHYVGFKSPDALAGNTVYTWPTAFPGSNMVLQSTSGGVLSWVAAGSGASAALDNLASVAINAALVAADASLALGAVAQRWTNVFLSGSVIWTDGAGTATSQIGQSVAGWIAFYGATTAVGSSARLASGMFVSWSSTTDPDGTLDTSVFRAAANTVGIGTGGSTLGVLRVGLGAAGAAAIQFGGTTNGIYSNGTLTIFVTNGNVNNLISSVGFETLSTGVFGFSSAGIGNPLDTVVGRSAAGVVQIGTTGVSTVLIGALKCATLVEANTAGSGAPNALTVGECRTLFTNEGATAENYHTLPTAAAGYSFEFVVQDTDGIRITAAAGDTIRVAAGVSAAAGFVRCATAGAVLCLKAINATEWIAMYQTAVWTVDA